MMRGFENIHNTLHHNLLNRRNSSQSYLLSALYMHFVICLLESYQSISQSLVTMLRKGITDDMRLK